MIRPRKSGKKGFKIDYIATRDLQSTIWMNARSFRSVDGHDVLFGFVDKQMRRHEIFERAKGRCELHLAPNCKGFVNWNSRDMEGWAHLDIEPHRNHCDCTANGAASCDPCHRWFHAHTKLAREILRRRIEAKKDFEKLHEGV